MSYDIYVIDEKTEETLELPHPHYYKGEQYNINGTSYAWLNVTYNYSEHYINIWGHDLDAFEGQSTLGIIYGVML